MSKVFRFELSRAMGGIRFRIAVVVGIAVSIMHFLTDVLPLVKWLDEWKGDSFAVPHSPIGIGSVWTCPLYGLCFCSWCCPFWRRCQRRNMIGMTETVGI